MTADPDDAGVALPVAVVAVDVPLPHLDRGFDYAVPPELSDTAVPGVRVKVRFAGRDVSGYVLARRAAPVHEGRLTPLRRVVSPEPVLTPRLADLCRQVADEHVGTLSDVLRLAIPPRHARAERALDAAAVAVTAPGSAGGPVVPASAGDAGQGYPNGDAWRGYPAGDSLLRRLAAGESPSAAWTALPCRDDAHDWPTALAQAAAATLASGRGALLVVPDARDLRRVEAALIVAVGPDAHVTLSAAQGPQARYTAWLKVLRGHVRCVAGTRSAAFAPVADLGLVAWWDDGDDAYEEPRAPYPHARAVLRAHAALAGAAALVGGFSRTAHTQLAIEDGLLREVLPEAVSRRGVAPRVHVSGEGADEYRDGPAAHAHLPAAAWRATHDALAEGPVLVQVPRRGYLPGVSCRTCHRPARCSVCAGPLGLEAAAGPPICRRCGAKAAAYVCPTCGDARLRSRVVGERRTAEELGRAFPGTRVETSSGDHVRDSVDARPALVIATPGAEPVAEGGYAAVLLLDAWASLDRPELDAGEEALRRWLGAAALARPRARVVLAGAPEGVTVPTVEALVRWAPEWFAARELAERAELDLPPAGWMATLCGARHGLQSLLDAATLPEGVERLGPLPIPGGADWQLLLRAPRARGGQVAAALLAAKGIRSARKDIDPVVVRIGTMRTGR
ncbi:MAG: primosome assembly protein PriA [Dermatophilaceae bacterium]